MRYLFAKDQKDEFVISLDSVLKVEDVGASRIRLVYNKCTVEIQFENSDEKDLAMENSMEYLQRSKMSDMGYVEFTINRSKMKEYMMLIAINCICIEERSGRMTVFSDAGVYDYEIDRIHEQKRHNMQKIGSDAEVSYVKITRGK